MSDRQSRYDSLCDVLDALPSDVIARDRSPADSVRALVQSRKDMSAEIERLKAALADAENEANEKLSAEDERDEATARHEAAHHNWMTAERLAATHVDTIERLERERDAVYAMLREIRTAFAPTWRLSPEGRAFLARLDALLPDTP